MIRYWKKRQKAAFPLIGCRRKGCFSLRCSLKGVLAVKCNLNLAWLNEWCYNVTDCIVLILSLFVESVSVNILISVKPVGKSPLGGCTLADVEAWFCFLGKPEKI